MRRDAGAVGGASRIWELFPDTDKTCIICPSPTRGATSFTLAPLIEARGRLILASQFIPRLSPFLSAPRSPNFFSTQAYLQARTRPDPFRSAKKKKQETEGTSSGPSSGELLHTLKQFLSEHSKAKRRAEWNAKFKVTIDPKVRSIKGPYKRESQRRFKEPNAVIRAKPTRDIVSKEPELQRISKSPILFVSKKNKPQPQRYILFPPYGSVGPRSITKTDSSQESRKMKSYIQVVSTPTADCRGTALILHFDKQKYLVGSLGEGTMRACNQFGARLLKVSDILITGRSEWGNLGGLVGIMLTIADSLKGSLAQHAENAAQRQSNQQKKEKAVIKPSVRFWGPQNLSHVVATCRRFVFRTGVPLSVQEVQEMEAKRKGDEPDWSDEHIRVWSLSIKPKAKTDASRLSPRKRSWDDLNDGDSIPQPTYQEDRAEREQLIRKAVVENMFNSNWRLDTLVEMPLKSVKLPATIFVRDPVTKKTSKYTGPLPGGTEPVPDPDIPVYVRLPWPAALVRDLPGTNLSEDSVSYIIKNHPQRGKFQPEKAAALKIPKGKLWAALTKGESVTNESGETITPEMVLTPGKEGGGVAVLDIPTLDYVEPLLARAEWSNESIMNGVESFVWILGRGVSDSPELRRFMDERKGLTHLVSSPDYCPNELTYYSSTKSTLKLRTIDPDRFGAPIHSTSPLSTGSALPDALPEHATLAKRGQVIHLEPQSKLDDAPPFDQSLIKEELETEVLEAAEKAQQEIAKDQPLLDAWKSTIPSPDAEVITLGTGSALPSKYRNVSSTLLRIPGYGSYLLDCGENTLGQLRRIFTPSELNDILTDLRMIWISHMHADHHLGTTSVIKAWYEAVHSGIPDKRPLDPILFQESPEIISEKLKASKMLSIVSDEVMHHWLAEYSTVEDFGYSRIAPLAIIPNHPEYGPSQLFWVHSAYPRVPAPIHHVLPGLLNLQDLQAVSVNHCNGAKAVSLTCSNGFKASYSGDCRPSQAFARIGKDTTVLIHEATFDDELQGDALAKKHSTTSEALGVGEAMNAKAVVLTHFSQRYQKIPVMEAASEDDDSLPAAPSLEPEGEENGEGEDAFVELPDIPRAQETAVADNVDAAQPSDDVPAGEKKTIVKIRNKDMKVCVGFDYMRVKVGDIAKMEYFTPALVRLFAKEEEEKEKDTEKEKEKAGDANPKPEKEGKNKKSKRFN